MFVLIFYCVFFSWFFISFQQTVHREDVFRKFKVLIFDFNRKELEKFYKYVREDVQQLTEDNVAEQWLPDVSEYKDYVLLEIDNCGFGKKLFLMTSSRYIELKNNNYEVELNDDELKCLADHILADCKWSSLQPQIYTNEAYQIITFLKFGQVFNNNNNNNNSNICASKTKSNSLMYGISREQFSRIFNYCKDLNNSLDDAEKLFLTNVESFGYFSMVSVYNKITKKLHYHKMQRALYDTLKHCNMSIIPSQLFKHHLDKWIDTPIPFNDLVTFITDDPYTLQAYDELKNLYHGHEFEINYKMSCKKLVNSINIKSAMKDVVNFPNSVNDSAIIHSLSNDVIVQVVLKDGEKQYHKLDKCTYQALNMIQPKIPLDSLTNNKQDVDKFIDWNGNVYLFIAPKDYKIENIHDPSPLNNICVTLDDFMMFVDYWIVNFIFNEIETTADDDSNSLTTDQFMQKYFTDFPDYRAQRIKNQIENMILVRTNIKKYLKRGSSEVYETEKIHVELKKFKYNQS